MAALKTDFIEKFQLRRLTITTIGAWLISVRPAQPTIGSLVLTLNRHCECFSDITQKEGAELASAFKETERILKSTFRPDKINYLALMMFDEQVHYHVIPRYQTVRSFYGREYADTAWPGLPFLAVENDEGEAEQVLVSLRSVS